MNLAEIESLLSQKVGFDSNIIGSRKIARAVESRRVAWNLSDLDAYLEVLQGSPQEFEELIEQMVVPETYFFRDRKPFKLLIDWVRSQWLSKPEGTKFRLLSVPCSSGEEPYSIAIALMEAGLAPERFSIDALDISKQAIAKAQRAVYGQNSFRGEAFIDPTPYFQLTPKGYQVCSSVRSRVNFQQGNILTAFNGVQIKYDVIFCRNLLIYLDLSARTKVFNTLNQLLIPEGLLFVGASETALVPSDRFQSLRQAFTFAYRKSQTVQPQKSLTKILVSAQFKEDLSWRFPESAPFLANPNSSQISASDRPNFQAASDSAQKIVQSPATQPLNLSLEWVRQLADSGQIEAAIDGCEQYLNRHLTSAEAHTLLGTLYQAKTDNKQAERCFQKALYLNPKSYEALIHLALLKEHRGDLAGAENLKQRIQKLQRNS